MGRRWDAAVMNDEHREPTPAQRQRAQATEDAWHALEDEFGLLGASEVAGRMGWTEADVHTAHRTGQLLAVHRGGQPLFPGYQLGPDRPRPVFHQLRKTADRLDVREASVLLWMITPTTWWSMEGTRPVDHLEDPAQIVRAFKSHFGVEW